MYMLHMDEFLMETVHVNNFSPKDILMVIVL